MAIYIRPNAEPFSAMATPGQMHIVPIVAPSQGGKVLEHEMERYCAGQVRGRSFLIAGHRGSGKTSMVDGALLRFQREALEGNVKHKPLPVYLQGPLLFDEEHPARPAAAQAGGRSPALVNVNVNAGTAAGDAGDRADVSTDELKHRVLIQVAQALHQAVTQEYCARFHGFARRHIGLAPPSRVNDLIDLAARFQIELTEAPHPSRLQEFWRQAGVQTEGLLFEPSSNREPHQGLAELVALIGVNHLHQRISGKLSEKDAQLTGASRHTESATGVESKWAELIKPLSAVIAGTAVAAVGASAGEGGASVFWGALAALGSMFVFRMSTVVKTQHERRVDRTFVPDLSIKTLHRVMPELFDRLFAAGLAPVFVVDELDKVDNLDQRIYPLIHGLKKLFAERSLTCLLVDRGFFERLHLREEMEKKTDRKPPPPWRLQPKEPA